jgi:tetratricopeptide (TPR) repeat protein
MRGRTVRRNAAWTAGCAVVLALGMACAPRTVPPPAVPAVARHPEFMFPAVPQTLQRAIGVEHIENGWRYLQADDLRNASREFTTALKRNPSLYPAQAGEGYVSLARGDHDRALAGFDAALRAENQYVPALVGRGQTLLAMDREQEALSTFEAALAADPSLIDLQRRIDVLRFRSTQQVVAAARTAAAAGRLDDARIAYERAIRISPDSAFLHRELGIVERRRGDADAALGHFRRATELDPTDTVPLIESGDLLADRQDFAGAEAAYRRAASIEPAPGLDAKIASVVERLREASLPQEFRAIPGATQITRGDLAALIAVRLGPLLDQATPRQVVVTDTRGHWASDWITRVAQAGVIEPFENHTFQPRAQVRRGDLAAAVSRVVALIAQRDAAIRARIAERPKIADMNAGHLSYPAASVAVASGVMPLLPGDRFQVGRAVTGAEATETIERLRALARSAPAP